MQVAPEVDVTALGGASDGDNTAAAASSRSRSSSARFLTPFNMLLGPVTIDQARYAQAACKAHGNAAVANFSAGSLCLATGALSAGDDAATARSDMAYTKGGDTAAAQAVLDAAPFGIDPVFLAGSALYDGSVAAERYYASFERATVPVDAAAPAGPARLHVPRGFFPHAYAAREGPSARHAVASRLGHFLAFVDPSCSRAQAKRMVQVRARGRVRLRGAVSVAVLTTDERATEGV